MHMCVPALLHRGNEKHVQPSVSSPERYLGARQFERTSSLRPHRALPSKWSSSQSLIIEPHEPITYLTPPSPLSTAVDLAGRDGRSEALQEGRRVRELQNGLELGGVLWICASGTCRHCVVHRATPRPELTFNDIHSPVLLLPCKRRVHFFLPPLFMNILNDPD